MPPLSKSLKSYFLTSLQLVRTVSVRKKSVTKSSPAQSECCVHTLHVQHTDLPTAYTAQSWMLSNKLPRAALAPGLVDNRRRLLSSQAPLLLLLPLGPPAQTLRGMGNIFRLRWLPFGQIRWPPMGSWLVKCWPALQPLVLDITTSSFRYQDYWLGLIV